MKYSSKNKPLQCMMTQSTCYKGTRKMTVKGVLWHSTGANNPTLRRYVQPDDNAKNRAELLKKIGKNDYGNDWNHIYVEAGLNAWIGELYDETVTTVQTMPWDYRPWGCGSGSKGSCNDGWIQFEICEDGLSNKTYFNKVYKEACELTAYLCTLYKLDPKGYTTLNGVKVPVILCHADSYDLGLGSGHADVMHWFKKHGKTMNDVRNDVAKLMNATTTTTTTKPATSTTTTSELYRVRKSWADVASQKGAFADKTNAINCCKKAGNGYEVYDSKGKVVYPEPKTTTTTKPTTTTTTKPATTTTKVTYKAGNKITLNKAELYASSTSKTKAGTLSGTYYMWDDEVINKRLRVTNSTSNVGKSSGVTGWVDVADIKMATTTASSASQSYKGKVTADVLNVRKGAGTNYAVVSQLRYNTQVTISKTSGNWGYISGKGWVCLDYIKKV